MNEHTKCNYLKSELMQCNQMKWNEMKGNGGIYLDNRLSNCIIWQFSFSWNSIKLIAFGVTLYNRRNFFRFSFFSLSFLFLLTLFLYAIDKHNIKSRTHRHLHLETYIHWFWHTTSPHQSHFFFFTQFLFHSHTKKNTHTFYNTYTLIRKSNSRHQINNNKKHTRRWNGGWEKRSIFSENQLH